MKFFSRFYNLIIILGILLIGGILMLSLSSGNQVSMSHKIIGALFMGGLLVFMIRNLFTRNSQIKETAGMLSFMNLII